MRISHPLNWADYNWSRGAEQASNDIVALLNTGSSVVGVLRVFALRVARLAGYARLQASGPSPLRDPAHNNVLQEPLGVSVDPPPPERQAPALFPALDFLRSSSDWCACVICRRC